ncbi:hypothetical protein C8T65DRAFT_640251, partial [Cerioporus squamosus]
SAAAVPAVLVRADDVDAGLLQVHNAGPEWKLATPTVEASNELAPRSVQVGRPVKPTAVGAIRPTIGPALAFSRTDLAISPLRPLSISFSASTRPAFNTFTPARVQRPSAATFSPVSMFSLSTPTFPAITRAAPGKDLSADGPEAAENDDDKDESGTVRALIIAVSIVSVLLALAIVVCIYLARKMKHQGEYYKEQLSARAGGGGDSGSAYAPGYQPQYVEGGAADQVPLVANEEKYGEARSRRSSVSSASSSDR